jgi:hypothetical protein
VRLKAVEEVASSWKDHPDTLTWLKEQAQDCQNVTVRICLMEQLAQGWKDDPEMKAFRKGL